MRMRPDTPSSSRCGKENVKLCQLQHFHILYRKVAANNCTKGVNDMYTARRQKCPNRAPHGLQLSTSEGKLTAPLHSNVTFLLQLQEWKDSSSVLRAAVCAPVVPQRGIPDSKHITPTPTLLLFPLCLVRGCWDFVSHKGLLGLCVSQGAAGTLCLMRGCWDFVSHGARERTGGCHHHTKLVTFTMQTLMTRGPNNTCIPLCLWTLPSELHITQHVRSTLECGTTATEAAAASCVSISLVGNPGDSMRTHIQLDFGDGTAVSYSNLTWAEEGIKHVYRSTGIFRVTALAENEMGTDSTSLYLHITCAVEHVQLLAPLVVIQNKEVNLTAVVWPSHSHTLTYFWWLGNSSEPIITLDGSISHTFTREGMHTVTLQVSSANSILQDTKTIAVQEFFKSLLLSFSPNLDEVNPDIPEWRQDVGRVIKKALLQVADIPESQLLVAVLPGVPTAAELFLLPSNNQSEGRKKSEEDLEQISEVLVSALNQNLVEFELKPAYRVIVYITQLTLAPLVDSIPSHSSSAMLMLLSVVFLGLVVFLIYKFKRKIPWINIDAEVNHEKEQEMINTVGQSEAAPKITLSEFPTQKEMMEKELECRLKPEPMSVEDSEPMSVEGRFTALMPPQGAQKEQ
ncbi:hypothetical protein ACEWY4_017791 [Coilia grayii]|uniref:PKD domain-containing protein n=1 Tax=Coilia grayii TaxID=363190 RepID=A0ABD1JHV6_9TELE